MGIEDVEAWRQRAHRERMEIETRNQRKDDRETLVLAIFRWLSMARADFPDIGARVSDEKLRVIAENVADAFLSS